MEVTVWQGVRWFWGLTCENAGFFERNIFIPLIPGHLLYVDRAGVNAREEIVDYAHALAPREPWIKRMMADGL